MHLLDPQRAGRGRRRQFGEAAPAGPGAALPEHPGQVGGHGLDLVGPGRAQRGRRLRLRLARAGGADGARRLDHVLEQHAAILSPRTDSPARPGARVCRGSCECLPGGPCREVRPPADSPWPRCRPAPAPRVSAPLDAPGGRPGRARSTWCCGRAGAARATHLPHRPRRHDLAGPAPPKRHHAAGRQYDGEVHATAWGPAPPGCSTSSPAMLGAGDDPSGFEPRHQVIARRTAATRTGGSAGADW